MHLDSNVKLFTVEFRDIELFYLEKLAFIIDCACTCISIVYGYREGSNIKTELYTLSLLVNTWYTHTYTPAHLCSAPHCTHCPAPLDRPPPAVPSLEAVREAGRGEGGARSSDTCS